MRASCHYRRIGEFSAAIATFLIVASEMLFHGVNNVGRCDDCWRVKIDCREEKDQGTIDGEDIVC